MADKPESQPPASAAEPKASNRKRKKGSRKRAKPRVANNGGASQSPYPRHPVDKALRIPRAILEQHAGKPATANEAASFVGAKKAHGPFRVELASASKY